MKKDKLYTVNKWNRPLFMPEEDRNIFDGLTEASNQMNTGSGLSSYDLFGKWGGAAVLPATTNKVWSVGDKNYTPVSGFQGKTNAMSEAAKSQTRAAVATPAFKYEPNVSQTLVDLAQQNSANTEKKPSAWLNTVTQAVSSVTPTVLNVLSSGTKNAAQKVAEKAAEGAAAKAAENTGKSLAKGAMKGAAWGVLAGAAETPFSVDGQQYKRGLYDALDPAYHAGDVTFSDGSKGHIESGVGNVFSDVGTKVFEAGAGTNPYIMLAGLGIKQIGNVINNGWGIAVNEEKLKEANRDIAKLKGFRSNASTLDEIETPEDISMYSDIYKGGTFKTGEANQKNREIAEAKENAVNFANRSVENNILNIMRNQYFNDLANVTAYGGPIDVIGNNNDMSAINYGFMSDYLASRRKQAENKNQLTNMFMGTPKTMFGIGGDLQTNSSDFSTGLMHIDAGGSHESSPYDGVQLGVDSNGTPNLVEENETVYNDYVYSARIKMDNQAKEKFHFPRKKDITYAEATKKLEKEIAERANDPISQAGFKAQMEGLAEEQERQKAEMEAARARETFEALSPEEQTAIMQRAAQEEQMAQQAAQEQAMAEQQVSPEEAAMAQQQMMQADGSEAMVGQEPEIAACGGKINKFNQGGKLKESIWNLIGVHTQSEWEAWKKKNGLDEIKDADDWDNILKNEAVMKAVTKDNPALAHAISSGYDFGQYTPGKSDLTFDDNRGNWDAQTVEGWWGSDDPAWKQVIEAHPELTKGTKLTREQLADYLRNTDAFQRGTKWLQDSEDNRLAYLQRIINNPQAPPKARAYAEKFADANGWKEGAKRDYDTIFNNPSGRAANPGTYWKTPIEATRGQEGGNYVINEDGSVEKIETEVPSDWVKDNTYSWAAPANDYTYNYYRRPAAAEATKTPEAASVEEQKAAKDATRGVVPNTKADWMRYAGLFGPAVGLGLQMAGVGKPDYSTLDAAVNRSGNVALANYQPIGNYLTYRPLDIWYAQNQMNANARATDRSILNSGANQGSKVAGLLASGYNNQIASGNLFRQAQEYNDALREKVEGFNRGTNQFNAEAYNRNSQFNASARNQANQTNAHMALQAAAQKLDSDAGWYNSLYGNIGGLFKGIGDLGKENAQHNMIAKMAANGLFGTATPDTPVFQDYLKWQEEQRKKGKKTTV